MGNLIDLNDRIFRELERLEAIDMDDTEARDAEFERARVIGTMVGHAISNANTALRAAGMQARAMDGLAERVSVPKMLIGGADENGN
ncbi:MAG: hypothetical protein IJF97_00645 [Eggerthellaceae bacterium]|nr:hypothetical protein [Eggerthellaceae bacterium]MBQ3342700.1 hypothetical protein [Kiritimatiellia bacterium]